MSNTRFPTVGILVRRVDSDDFDMGLWRTVFDLAQKEPCNLLLVRGSAFLSEAEDRTHSAVYRLLNPGVVDCGIVSQTVTAWMSEQDSDRFSAELTTIPFVTTSIKYGQRPCLYVDNTTGLRHLIRHLIDAHGCRRIVHLRGPRANLDAQVREDVWREELLRAGIEPQERWLVQAHFDPERLKTIGRDLMEQTKGEFDAVVACNDVAAFHTIEDLQAQGYRVPEDYLVCGYDDTVQCQFSMPSLTTVRQPTSEQLARSWAMLRQLREGGVVPPDEIVRTSLVIRGSCSCPPPAWTPDAFVDLESHLARFAGHEPKLVALASHNFSEAQRIVQREREISQFYSSMNQVTNQKQLVEVLQKWLPALGVKRFAFFVTCSPSGNPRPFLCHRKSADFLPESPDFFQVLVTEPYADFGSLPLSGSRFSMEPWYRLVEPFTLGSFPLVIGDTWYGLAFLDVFRDAGRIERPIQEQVTSVLHRLALESALREKNLEERTRTLVQTERMAALRRLVSSVAHEINTPLGAILSANSTLAAGIGEPDPLVSEPASPLSAQERDVLLRLGRSAAWSALSHKQIRDLRRAWVEVLRRSPVLDPEKTADELVTIEWGGELSELEDLAKSPVFEGLVEYQCKKADQAASSRIIFEAADKISHYVSGLSSMTLGPAATGSRAIDIRASLDDAVLVLKKERPRASEVLWESKGASTVLCLVDELRKVWISLLRHVMDAGGAQGRAKVVIRDEGHWVAVTISSPRSNIKLGSRAADSEGWAEELYADRQVIEGFGGTLDSETQAGQTVFHVRLLPYYD